jgi:hypothetical protein
MFNRNWLARIVLSGGLVVLGVAGYSEVQQEMTINRVAHAFRTSGYGAERCKGENDFAIPHDLCVYRPRDLKGAPRLYVGRVTEDPVPLTTVTFVPGKILDANAMNIAKKGGAKVKTNE